LKNSDFTVSSKHLTSLFINKEATQKAELLERLSADYYMHASTDVAKLSTTCPFRLSS
jgi:hypothetical protein